MTWNEYLTSLVTLQMWLQQNHFFVPLASGLTYGLLSWHNHKKRQRRYSSNPKIATKTNRVQCLEAELVQLLNGDRQGALRLVRHVHAKNPTRDAAWCWEKAISDLERDRRV